MGFIKGRRGRKHRLAIIILEKITNMGGKYLNEYFRATKVLDHKIIATTNAIKGIDFLI